MKNKKKSNRIWTVLFWLAVASVVLGCCMPANLGSLSTATSKSSASDKDAKKSSSEEKEVTENDDDESESEETEESTQDQTQDEQEEREDPEETDEEKTEPEESESEPAEESEDETEPQESSEETSRKEDPGLSYDDYIRMFKEGDYSYVTPSFKETMDSYEEFYDEYCEFMKKYLSGGNLMEMLNDYTAMIEKEAEMAEKLDSIDSDSLSTADAAYYSYVSLKISNKLLSIYS